MNCEDEEETCGAGSAELMEVVPINANGAAPDRKEVKSLLHQHFRHPMRTCAVLSMCFVFAYTANLAIQNLQSSLHQAGELGITSLAVLYGAIIWFCSLSPVAIRLLRAKWVLVIAWVCHTLYTLSNFYPTFPTLLTSSLLLGVLAGPMWTSQGLYMSEIGQLYADSKKIELHAALSRVNGIFFACYESTQITGNLLSSVVFMRDTYNHTILLSEDRICGADTCPNQPRNSTGIEQPAQYIVYTLLSIFLACNILAVILSVVGMPHLPRSQESSSEGVTKSLTSCLSMILEPRMLLLLPFFMAQAMNSGILTASYTQSFVSCSVGVQWVGYVMAAFGAITVVLAISLNFSAKYIGRRVLFISAAVADMSWVLSMVFWDPKGNSPGMFFILPVVSGFAEAIFQAQFYSLVAMVFPEEMLTGAFAMYHASKAMAFTLTFVLARFLCLRSLLYVALGLSALGLTGYVTLEIILAHERRKTERQSTDGVNHASEVKDSRNSTDF